MDTTKVAEQGKGGGFSFYWTYYHLKNLIVGFAREHRKAFAILFSLLLAAAFILRPFVQSFALTLRIYSAETIIIVGLTYGFFGVLKRRMAKLSYVIALVMGVLIVWPHDYVTLALRYYNLKTEDMALPMETAHERILPLNSVRDNINRQFNQENYQYTEPYFVRSASGDYRWTAGKEPVNGSQSYIGGVDEVVSISASDASPDYSRMKSHIPVKFSVGDHLHLGKNSWVAAVRSLGPLQFFSYEPDKVRYVEEKKGQFVQLIPFTRHSGFLYPQKEFGGVQIIRQTDGGLLHFLKTAVVGDGEYVAPEDIGKYPFLRGQNLVPYQVSRYIAESFSFRNGIWENVPWNTNGAVRIPDLPGDANDQPFAVCFKQENGEEKIFQYFGMEPLLLSNHGHALSIHVPGDGLGPVKVYDHIKHGDSMIGVSSVGGNIQAADQHIDWNNTQPAEHRPFIRTIMGARRFLWFSTLVTNTKSASASGKTGDNVEGVNFHAGGVPNVWLTEPHKQHPIRVDAMHADEWTKELEKVFAPYWR